MKKLTALFLVFLLALCLAACGAKKPEQPDDTTPAETQPESEEKEMATIFETSKRSPFRLVYSAQCTDTEYGLVNKMKNAAEKEMWAVLNIRDDAKEPEAKEILLGHTNRPESEAALEEIADNEYIVSFDGEKLVLNAKDPYGTVLAVRWFLNEYVKGKDTCSLEVGMKVKQTYDIPEQVTILRNLKRGINVLCHDEKTALTRTAETFQMLVDSGFDHVRFPVTFPLFLDENKVFDETKMQALDGAVNAAMDAGLPVILDLHFWDVLCGKEAPAPDDVELFYSMWRQIAARYADYPAKLCYQFLNEPHGDGLTDALWNEMQMKVYREVRAIDPTRILFFSSTAYNKSRTLGVMEIPDDDDFVAIDVHDYFPESFTHYNVLSVCPDGVYYPYSKEIFTQFRDALNLALDYRKKTGIPMIIGEFSASPYLPEADYTAFLSDVTAYMEQHQIAWTYWELDDYWAVYDKNANAWKEPRYGGLMGQYKLYMKEGD